jgi:hypothetical protein
MVGLPYGGTSSSGPIGGNTRKQAISPPVPKVITIGKGDFFPSHLKTTRK